jgi:PST family polysaccharide transporter
MPSRQSSETCSEGSWSLVSCVVIDEQQQMKLIDRLRKRVRIWDSLKNSGWLFGNHLVKMVLGLAVGIWVARYLGPERYGLLNFGLAIVALLTPVATLGLTGLLVRQLVNEPSDRVETLGTAFVLRFLGGLVSTVLCIIGAHVLRPNDAVARAIIFIIALTPALRSAEVVKQYFEAEIRSKYFAIVDAISTIVVSIGRVILILVTAPVVWFAWAVLLQFSVSAIGLLWIYDRKTKTLRLWRVSIDKARALLSDSWPLIISGLVIVVYMRIDQVMLGQMMGDGAVGVYTVAVRLSELWYFIPTAVVASVFPHILADRKISQALYMKNLQKLFDALALLAFGIALPMTFLSGPVVNLLYGEGYAQAGTVLAIHIWASLFVFVGLASSKWFLAENMQLQSMYRTGVGAAINVGANFVLIPRYGAVGAALATLMAQMLPWLLLDPMRAETRRIMRMRVRALLIIPAVMSLYRRKRHTIT